MVVVAALAGTLGRWKDAGVNGPSASWYAISGGGTLVGVVVLLFDGVYWPLLLLPLVAFTFWMARRASRAER